ncbi:MOSC domain-containing protein [soil metagenome]
MRAAPAAGDHDRVGNEGSHPRVTGVFVGESAPFPPESDNSSDRSGILKRPIDGHVEVLPTGLAGDVNVERPPGDTDQAVCAYPVEHYRWWNERFAQAAIEDFGPSTFGENLTVQNLLESQVCVGDVFAVGTSLLEVSKPRGPCRKIGQRTGIPNLAAEMRRSLRTGWYMRVRRPGSFSRYCRFVLVERPSPGVTVELVAATMYLRRQDLDSARRALTCDTLADNWRAVFEARVAGHAEPARPDRD